MRSHEIDANTLGPGRYEIGIGLRHSNLVLEKIVVDLGGLRDEDSYLDPPMSYFVE